MKKAKRPLLVAAIVIFVLGAFVVINKELTKDQVTLKTDKTEQKNVSKTKDDKEDEKSLIIDKKIETKDDETTETLFLDKKATDKQAKSILNQSVEELRKKHSNKKIHVKVIRNKKKIADKTVLPNKKETEEDDEFYVKDIQLK